MNYYNEWDKKTAVWLRELVNAGLIPNGHVDDRDIRDVTASDLRGYVQCHFFAGIAGWPLALKLAGWNENRPVWTGSCPCQPWSIGNFAHGGAKGKADVRHLWPYWYRLICKCKPDVVVGEQVARAIKMGWLDEVFGNLEAEAYTCWARVLRARDFGYDHERKRLYFLAYSSSARWERHQSIKRFSFAAEAPLTLDGDPAARARRAMAGDYSDLLPCNGLSVQLERDALKGYGNAIPIQVAASFVKAFEEAIA